MELLDAGIVRHFQVYSIISLAEAIQHTHFTMTGSQRLGRLCNALYIFASVVES